MCSPANMSSIDVQFVFGILAQLTKGDMFVAFINYGEQPIPFVNKGKKH
jgi:hypothetical protein